MKAAILRIPFSRTSKFVLSGHDRQNFPLLQNMREAQGWADRSLSMQQDTAKEDAKTGEGQETRNCLIIGRL